MDEHIPYMLFGAMLFGAMLSAITIWLYSRDKKTQQQQQQPEEEKDQDTDNYTCVLLDCDGLFINTVEKSCLDCQHSFISANKAWSCNCFKIANPINEKRVLVNCNEARQLYKLCGREAKHFQPKEIKGTTENE